MAISSKAEGSKLQRLTIVSEVPTSRKRTTYQTRRILKPDEDVSNSRRTSSALEEGNRPRAGVDEFRVLKEAEEGVWYRRLVDEEGVRLIRVKTDDALLNGDQGRGKNDNYMMLEDKKKSEPRVWYRRVDNGEGGVRLVRVRNDDIFVNSLKTLITETTVRKRIASLL